MSENSWLWLFCRRSRAPGKWEISGPVTGNTAEASTFDIDEQIYGIDLSGVAKVPAYLLPGNDVLFKSLIPFPCHHDVFVTTATVCSQRAGHLARGVQEQRFTLAPCLIQTPPCWTCLPHPSWLQRFTLAPCLIQTPPCRTCLPHPSWLQRLRFLAPLSLLCLMPRPHLA